jgi:predicted ATPase/class 3 adenylate cyclase
VRGDLPTGTVTFLFTDIEGSTRLLHALGPNAYADALAEHRRIVREAFGKNGGVEVDTQGDAFFVAFPTADGAAAASLEARAGLSGGPISVRMGLHTGTPNVAAEGYVGIDVHRGARVAALAHGGQIVVSPTTAALLEGEAVRDLGAHRLKDFEGSTRLYQLGSEDFAPLRAPGSVDLPTPATRFFGRERELFEAVSIVYDEDPRVLTVLGPGGTGKTRFALELCRLLAEEADGGTVFCAFAPLREPELVMATLAERLGAASADAATIAARVGERRTHVLVDNVEHLLPDAARPQAELAAAAPLLRLYVTSREALRIQPELELDLPTLAEREAVALFLARARAVRPDLVEDEAVGTLCARLDRLPLALELAAARTKLLSPEALLDRLGQSLDLLKGARDVDERHTTLRTTIAWSYDLLDADEQKLFARMSVFAAGATLDSAEFVCGAELDTLASLLDKSLVRRRTGPLGEERYWLLETIREFAAERLAESGESEVVERRHAERMLELARSAHLSEDDDHPFQLEVALAERDDVRAALDWSAANDARLGLELVVALETFWNAHAPSEGLQRVASLLDRAGPLDAPLLARAHRVYGNTASLSGDDATGDMRWQLSLQLFRELDDERAIAGILHRLALSPLASRDYERARSLVDESQALAAGRFRLIETVNLHIYAELARSEGRVEEAWTLERRSAEEAHDMGWLWWESGRRDVTIRLALTLGRLDEAEEDGRAALAIERAQENRQWAVHTLSGLAQVALARGEVWRAGMLWGAAEAEADRHSGIGFPARPGSSPERSGALPMETRPEFLAATSDGRRLDLWQAVAIALGELEPPQTVP